MARIGAALAVALGCLGAATPADARRARGVPAPPGPMTIHPTGCPETGVPCAYPELGEVFLPADTGRWEREHEMGHMFDHQVLRSAHRWQFAKLLRAPSPSKCAWLPETGHIITTPGCSAVPLGEVFADAYANCRVRWNPDRRAPQVIAYGYDPSARTHRLVCALIRSAAKRSGLYL